jgi:hypothetical protein
MGSQWSNEVKSVHGKAAHPVKRQLTVFVSTFLHISAHRQDKLSPESSRDGPGCFEPSYWTLVAGPPSWTPPLLAVPCPSRF